MSLATLPAIDRKALETDRPLVSGMANRAKALMSRPLTLQVVHEAHELDTEAKSWLAAWAKKTDGIKQSLFRAHRDFTAFVGEMAIGATGARNICGQLIAKWARQEAEKKEAERRGLEEEARQAQLAAQKAEVDHLLEQGELDAAIEVEQSPPPVVVVPELPPMKVGGVSTGAKKVGKLTDRIAFIEWLLRYRDDPILIDEFVDLASRQGNINRALNRGMTIPGWEVQLEGTYRNLTRVGES